MPEFNGTLHTNEIYSGIRNMIISQTVAADNIKGTKSSLADRSRVDGTLYGDTKLYYATDALESYDWLNDAEAENLLKLHRPESPAVQAITIDKFRQIAVTTDKYLSKRAWSSEGTFGEFNSVMLGWIGDTKKIYDSTLVNAFYGTEESAVGEQSRAITLPSGGTTEETNRLEAQAVAEELANLLVGLEDVSRDFNDYGFLRSYAASDFIIVWNSKVYNKILKIDLPTIFHNEGLEGDFDKVVLPARFFGKALSAAAAGVADKSVRSLIEQRIGSNHYFPGDAIKVGDTAPAGTAYKVDDKILFKVVHKRSVPYMSAFSTSTVFVNPRSLTETNYLTFGHNTLEHLKNYPFITVRKA